MMEAYKELKIFVVDDDVFCANLHVHYLKNLCFEDTTLFVSGIECLDNMHQNPDVIFLDHNMDDMTGFEVLKRVKRLNPNVFVIMISAQEEIKTAVDALKYGAFDYIIKDHMVESKIKMIMENIIRFKEIKEQKNAGFFRKFLSLF